VLENAELYDLEKDEIIKIKIATKKAKMLHRSSRDFFKVLSEKLRWGN
jgi:NAD+ kinase